MGTLCYSSVSDKLFGVSKAELKQNMQGGERGGYLMKHFVAKPVTDLQTFDDNN